MNAPAASLIQAAAEADRAAPPFSFFSDVQEEAEKTLAAAGEFTGERLFRDRPAVYAAAVRMIAEGLSISAAARALGISRNTVCAVRDREGVSVEQEKKELLRDLNRASRLGVEKVLELLPETKSAKDAAIVAAVMIDKRQLIGGEATSRVERVDVKPDQVKAYLDALPVLDAELVEISMGIPGEAAGQKGAELEAGGLVLPAPSSDMGSDVMAHDNSDNPVDRATPRATSLENTPLPGGGGGVPSSIPQSPLIESEKQNFGQKPNAGRPAARVPALGDGDAGESLCKRTNNTKKGGAKATAKQRARSSQKVRISQKKKGGSGC